MKEVRYFAAFNFFFLFSAALSAVVCLYRDRQRLGDSTMVSAVSSCNGNAAEERRKRYPTHIAEKLKRYIETYFLNCNKFQFKLHLS